MSLPMPLRVPTERRDPFPPRLWRPVAALAPAAPSPGATLDATLPQSAPGRSLAPPRSDGGDRPGSAATGPAARPSAAAARLLVVEDDWFIALEIEAIAQAAGYEVVGLAATADEALALGLDRRPDLALMDIRLAGPRDGIEAAIELRERADIPCLFVSAHHDPGVQAKAAPARPAGWLSKPFTEPQLTDAILQALGESPTGRGGD